MVVKYTRELLDEAARETTNFDDAVRWCGGKPTPGSTHYIRAKMAEAGIDTSHFTTARVRHTEETLRTGRLFQERGRGRTSIGNQLVLEIDRVNADRLDNRRQNLRFLCPSRHSQTATFSHRFLSRRRGQ
jgi:hypothetical protein